jgi:D-alanyl-D-alanine carboxypeptidase (penicillin-binding protein 5/6)
MQQRTILALAFVMMLVITVVTVIVVSLAFPNLQFLVRLVVSDATPTQAPTAIPTPTPTPSPTPAPFITGTAAYLIDADTGRVLYSLHSTQQLPIASTTKIMTAIVTIENANLDQGIIVQQSDLDQVPPDASTAGLVVGDYFRLRTLLYGLMLPSGTDASIVIARAVAGSTANFVAMMNRKAQLLHLTHTHFSSPHGYSGVDHYSCAADLVTLANYAMGNMLFAHIVAQAAYNVRPSLYTHAYHWENKNALLTTYQGADGVKTGWTDTAGVCLVFSAHRNGYHLIGVVLQAPSYDDVFADGAKLLNLGFSKEQSARYQSVVSTVAQICKQSWTSVVRAALIQSSAHSVPATFQGVIGPGHVRESMQAGARSSRDTTAPCRWQP